ncbi:hypothetical protein DFH09DRAFT_1104893 [Mycena vulgaris]|nr:hypothetical protein DFH09DRAFT_1104893 [Mycena vulgaris]
MFSRASRFTVNGGTFNINQSQVDRPYFPAPFVSPNRVPGIASRTGTDPSTEYLGNYPDYGDHTVPEFSHQCLCDACTPARMESGNPEREIADLRPPGIIVTFAGLNTRVASHPLRSLPRLKVEESTWSSRDKNHNGRQSPGIQPQVTAVIEKNYLRKKGLEI